MIFHFNTLMKQIKFLYKYNNTTNSNLIASKRNELKF